MSVLVAVYNRDGRPANPALARKMAAAMRHRAADAQAVWNEGSVAMAHGAQSTLPQSVGERQPLADDSGALHLIFDGRINNREELRSALGGKPAFRTAGDAEIVLRAYERWGEDCPAHLLGDFAFALWDFAEHKLFCARDPLGQRPFFYTVAGRTFACASEIQPLLLIPGMDQVAATFIHSLDPEPEPTSSRGIVRLPGGCSLTVDHRGERKRVFWNLDPERKIPPPIRR